MHQSQAVQYASSLSNRHLSPYGMHPPSQTSINPQQPSDRTVRTNCCRVESAHRSSDDMAPFLLLMFLLSAAASEEIKVTVRPGDNVTLPCQDPDSSISAAQWTRPDLEPDYVLLYNNGQLDTTHQHPSFKDRVDLVDKDLKNGDVSLTLKNVSRHDNGTYECRVITDGSRRMKRDNMDSEPIRTFRLQVSEPGVTEPGVTEPAGSPGGLVVGLAVGVVGVLVLVAVAAVVGVLKYKGQKKKRKKLSGQPSLAVLLSDA